MMYLNINHQPLVAKSTDQHRTINFSNVSGWKAKTRPHYCIKIAENKKTHNQLVDALR